MRWFHGTLILAVCLCFSQGTLLAQCRSSGMTKGPGSFMNGSSTFSGSSSLARQPRGGTGFRIPQGGNFGFGNPQGGVNFNIPQGGYSTGLNPQGSYYTGLNPQGGYYTGLNPQGGYGPGQNPQGISTTGQVALQQTYAMLNMIVQQLQNSQVTRGWTSVQVVAQDLQSLGQLNMATNMTPAQKNALARQYLQQTIIDLQNVANDPNLPTSAQAALCNMVQQMQQTMQMAQ
jgi:hypothetical protein